MGNIVNLFKTNNTYKIFVMRNPVIYFLKYKKLSMRSDAVFYFAGKKVKVLNRVTVINPLIFNTCIHCASLRNNFFFIIHIICMIINMYIMRYCGRESDISMDNICNKLYRMKDKTEPLTEFVVSGCVYYYINIGT